MAIIEENQELGEPLDREAAAKMIGISIQGMDLHIKRGTFRSVKLAGRRIFYKEWLKADLRKLVEGGGV